MGGIQPSPSRQPSLDGKGSLGTPPPPMGGIGVRGDLRKKDPYGGIFFPFKKKSTHLSVNFFLFYMFRIT